MSDLFGIHCWFSHEVAHFSFQVDFDAHVQSVWVFVRVTVPPAPMDLGAHQVIMDPRTPTLSCISRSTGLYMYRAVPVIYKTEMDPAHYGR